MTLWLIIEQTQKTQKTKKEAIMLKHFTIDNVEKEEALAYSYFNIDDAETLQKTEHLFNITVWDDDGLEKLFNNYMEFKHFNILGDLKKVEFLKLGRFSNMQFKKEVLPHFQESFLKRLRELDDVIECSTNGMCRNTYERKLMERHTQLLCFMVDFVTHNSSAVLKIKSTTKNYINGGQSMTGVCKSGLHFN